VTAGTNLYCLVTEACECEQLAQGCYLTAAEPAFETTTVKLQVRQPSRTWKLQEKNQ